MQTTRKPAFAPAWIAFFAWALAAHADTYFVSPEGSDEHPGTQAAPFRTIQRAADAAQPGDAVQVAAGRYNEAVVFPRSGEPGKPIVFEGERGAEGEWLSVLDRSMPATGWTPAPEVGEGVFQAKLGFNPGCMTLDGKMLARIRDDFMADNRGLDLFTIPADEPLKGSERVPSLVVSESYNVDEHGFWDGLRVLYGYRDGTTYLRFRGGDDPREMKLLAAAAGGGFVLRNRGHVVLRGFLVRGAEIAVEIAGEQAVGNVVEGNRLTHGRMRVLVAQGASQNVIRGNEMTLGYFGHDRPGAWGTANPTMATSLAHYVYRTFKFIVGRNSSDDSAVAFVAAGEGNEVVGNRIAHGLMGISVGQAPRLRVHRNIISNMSSIGIVTSHTGGYGPLDAEFHDNLVYDCNINLRLHQINQVRPGQRREYHYRNIYHQSGPVGSNIFVHWLGQEMAEDRGHPEIFLYHNTISGGHRGGFLPPGIARLSGGMPGTRLINNLFSTSMPWYTHRDFYAERGMIDVADYNWLGGTLHHGVAPAWMGENNVVAEGRRMWPPNGMPDFRLPAHSDARQAGLDLSRPFTVQDRRFPALPGMLPGYFQGKAPDLGAVQFGQTPLVPLLP